MKNYPSGRDYELLAFTVKGALITFELRAIPKEKLRTFKGGRTLVLIHDKNADSSESPNVYLHEPTISLTWPPFPNSDVFKMLFQLKPDYVVPRDVAVCFKVVADEAFGPYALLIYGLERIKTGTFK